MVAALKQQQTVFVLASFCGCQDGKNIEAIFDSELYIGKTPGNYHRSKTDSANIGTKPSGWPKSICFSPGKMVNFLEDFRWR